jgi:SAM-dependent methyltransferase
MQKDFYTEYFELEDWHWWFIGRRRIFLRILDRYLPPAGPEGWRLLDVGCGTGTMLVCLAGYGEARGIDADEEAVRFCRRRGLENAEHVTSETLPFDDDAFNVVTALDVLEHVDDDTRMLREIRRVLRPGGTLLVSVPAYRFLWGPQDEISHHKRRYTARQIGARAAAAGFAERRLTYFNTLLFPPIAALRVLRSYRRGPIKLKSDFSLTSPGRMNSLLTRVFASEAPLVERFDLPFGVSILGLFVAAGAPRSSAEGNDSVAVATGASPNVPL